MPFITTASRSASRASRPITVLSPLPKLLNADSAHYRQATEEALLLLRWIRQFAAALGGK